MIGSTISRNPARSRISANRHSMRRRRAVSSIDSGRTPVGYRNLLTISKKPLPRVEKRFKSVPMVLALAAPLLDVGRSTDAPLHHVVMMVVQPVSESEIHKSAASVKTHVHDVKFLARE